MKRTLTIIAVIWSACYAQEKDLAVAKVHYMFKHINDTTQPENFLRDEVVTYIGQAGSYYTSYSSARISEQMDTKLKDPTFDGNLTLLRNTSAIRESYIFKPLDEQFWEIRRLVNDFYVLDINFPEQDWIIGDETRKIGGYTCQKASTHFKGRDYTAWFTTELPFAYGPWKLHGLPGLILEAYDTKKEVVFEYNGFDKEFDGNPFAITVPENAHAVSWSEFNKQQTAYEANPQAYRDARLGTSRTVREVSTSPEGTATGGGMAISSGGAGTARMTVTVAGRVAGSPVDPSNIKAIRIQNDENYKPSTNTNNPIELVPQRFCNNRK